MMLTVGVRMKMMMKLMMMMIITLMTIKKGMSMMCLQNKCAQYWPAAEQEAEIFDEFVVKLNGEDLCPDYVIRRLSLTNVSLHGNITQ